jgi:hypothetical protein
MLAHFKEIHLYQGLPLGVQVLPLRVQIPLLCIAVLVLVFHLCVLVLVLVLMPCLLRLCMQRLHLYQVLPLCVLRLHRHQVLRLCGQKLLLGVLLWALMLVAVMCLLFMLVRWLYLNQVLFLRVQMILCAQGMLLYMYMLLWWLALPRLCLLWLPPLPWLSSGSVPCSVQRHQSGLLLRVSEGLLFVVRPLRVS